MRIYFFVSNTAGESRKILKVIESLELAGYLVVTNLQEHEQSVFLRLADVSFSPQKSLLEKIDLFIFEGGTQNQEAAYLVALALSSKKPVLYLLPKGAPVDPAIQMLQENSSSAKFFKVKFYTLNKIKDHVFEWVNLSEQLVTGRSKDLANIKFTLRITESIERYTNWQAKRKRMTKANFLRLLLQNMLESDESYRKYLESMKKKYN